jgi:HAD superfamily hydrolase (TIGR01549 family)
MTLKVIIWDLDGTLIHFNIDFLRARREAIRILKEHGISRGELTVRKSILENVEHSVELFKKKGISPQQIQSIITKIDTRVAEIEFEAALEAKRIDNIENVVQFAQHKGLKQAIYTFNTHRNAETSLKNVKLFEYFDIIVGRDDVENPKPHKDHLLTICSKLDVEPEDTLVIGDTYRDIQGAKIVGAKSIAIKTKTSGFSNKDIFNSADAIVEQEEISENLIPTIKRFLDF